MAIFFPANNGVQNQEITTNIFRYSEWAPLNAIMDNVINRLMRANLSWWQVPNYLLFHTSVIVISFYRSRSDLVQQLPLNLINLWLILFLPLLRWIPPRSFWGWAWWAASCRRRSRTCRPSRRSSPPSGWAGWTRSKPRTCSGNKIGFQKHFSP